MEKRFLSAFAAVGVLGALTLCGCGSSPLPAAMSPLPLADAGLSYDVTVRTIPTIPSGLVIGDAAPEGFSHLVLKSCPRVAPDSLAQVSETTQKMVSMFKTIIAAEVKAAESEPRRYQLASVATGLATDIDGRDVIVSSGTAASVGLKLGFVESSVLSGVEEFLNRGRCVARSRSSAILDLPSLLVHEGKHREIVFRYALLVDESTGELTTLIWALLTPDKAPRELIGQVQVLRPNHRDDCLLHVDRNAYVFGIPTAAAYATSAIPAGRASLTLPADLAALAAESPLTEASAEALDAGLRKAVAGLQLR